MLSSVDHEKSFITSGQASADTDEIQTFDR